MPFSRSLPLLLCCLGAVSHGGSWQNVNLRDADLFSDHCLYRAQLESFSNWYLAMGSNEYALTFSPMDSVSLAGKYKLVINAGDKTSPYLSTPKGGESITFGTSKLQKWCPAGKGFISADLYGNYFFNDNCLHRVRGQSNSFKFLASSYSSGTLQLAPDDFAGAHKVFSVFVQYYFKSLIEMTSSAQQPSQMATQEIDALCQNVNWINQSLTDSSKFKIDCIYQVRLDNAYQWQQAYGSDTIGFDLYINPYIPSKVSNGVARTISWISKKDYITKEGSNSTRGTVLAMRYFCP